MKSSFSTIIQSEVPILIDFHAEWCGPCKAMAPVLKELAGEVKGKAKIIKIDIDKNPVLAEKYQVKGVPTFMVFKQGELKWRQSGMMPKDMLKKVLSQHTDN
ncbi:MAG: thioredoxin [Bacteroidota bacterium]